MATIKRNLNTSLVRLTKTEMSQLKKLKAGSIFYHVNLEHGNTNHINGQKMFLAVEIIQNGLETNSATILPKIDFSVEAPLKLISITRNVPVVSLTKIVNLNEYLLANKNGLIESLFDKYSKVRNLSYTEICNMNCYIRKFKIV